MNDRTQRGGPPPCPRGEEAVGFALHALEPDEELAMRAHIEHCGSCAETVRETELVAAAVAMSVDQVDPPPRLRAGILAAAAETPQVLPAPAPAPGAPRSAPVEPHPRFAARRAMVTRSRVLLAVAAAAAVIAVAGLGTYAAQVRQQRDALAAQAQELAGLVTRLDAPGTTYAALHTDTGHAVAAVLVTPEGRTVVATGLDPNDTTASTYVVWGIGEGGPSPLAAFDVVAGASGVHELGSSDGAPDGAPFSAYAVSIEPGRAMPTTPTTVVAKGEVRV